MSSVFAGGSQATVVADPVTFDNACTKFSEHDQNALAKCARNEHKIALHKDSWVSHEQPDVKVPGKKDSSDPNHLSISQKNGLSVLKHNLSVLPGSQCSSDQLNNVFVRMQAVSNTPEFQSETEMTALLEALAQVPETGTLFLFEQLFEVTHPVDEGSASKLARKEKIEKFLVKLTWNGRSRAGFTVELFKQGRSSKITEDPRPASQEGSHSSGDSIFLSAIPDLTQPQAFDQIQKFMTVAQLKNPGARVEKTFEDLVLIYTQAEISNIWSDRAPLEASAISEYRGKTLFKFSLQNVSCSQRIGGSVFDCTCTLAE